MIKLVSELVGSIRRIGFLAIPVSSGEVLQEILKQAEEQGMILVQLTIMGLQSEDGVLLYDSSHGDYKLVPYALNGTGRVVDRQTSHGLHQDGYMCIGYGYEGAHYFKHLP